VNVLPLAVHSPRVIEQVLRSYGWDAGRAADAAGGIHPAAFLLTGLDAAALEALVSYAGPLGLGVVTGDDWAVLAGSASRFGALARPWTVPPALAEIAVQVGTAMPPAPATQWRTARGSVPLGTALVVGILNVTPDSFSDGGRHEGPTAALAHAARLLEDGAAIVDVGGESTRPGRTGPVPLDEELRRVVPVITALVREHPALLVSVDTVKAEVARAALEAGAAIVNDVSALRLDPAMAGVIAGAGAGAILMHSRGGILELASYAHANYPAGVTAAVLTELGDGVRTATAAGISAEAIVVDPGLGFSKTVPQNLELLDQIGSLLALGRPVMVGPSRKRFLAGPGDTSPADRDVATAAACVMAWERGARLFRVHDVAGVRDALALVQSVADSDPSR
jgi:dihydropteroate synthase